MWFFLLWLWGTNQDIEFTVDESLRVEYIMLDIVARTKKGELVTDLKPSDFVVKDNRKKMQPDVFQILDYRQGQAVDDDGDAIPLPTRQFILALDTESAQYQEGLEAFAQLREFIKGLGEDYPYTIKIISLERDSLKPEFVDNSAAALAEIDALEARFKRFNKPYTPPDYEQHSDMILFGGGDRRVDLNKRGHANFSQIEEAVNHLAQLEKAFIECERRFGRGAANCIRDTLQEFMFQQENRSNRVFSELERLAYKFEDVEGLKTLLFVSAGFAFNVNATPYELAAIYMGQPDRRGSLDQPGMLFMTKPFQRVAHACTKNRVIFHTFNIFDDDAGLHHSISRGARDNRVFRVYKGYGYEMSEGLRGLAKESGGQYFDRKDLGPALKQALEQDQFFYVLGYPAPGGRQGKFHRIKVKVKRKGVVLSYRRGYFGR